MFGALRRARLRRETVTRGGRPTATWAVGMARVERSEHERLPAETEPSEARGYAESEPSVTRLRGDDLVGGVVAGRHIEARLAAGAQAVIYRTHHTALGRREVLKVLRRSPNPKAAERFLHEAQVLAAIRSPYTPTIYDYGTTDDDRAWLAMEYIDGMNLGDLIAREGRLSLPRALTIAEQLCLVLAEAHARDTIHRDLKPDNVLIERGEQGERVRLLDFGVAHHKDHKLTLPGRIYGTPGYLAPEQLDGSVVDGRCDLFALGVVLYEMLTGSNPFQVGGHSLTEMFGRLMVRFDTPLPPLSDVLPEAPPSIDAWLRQLLARDRNERPNDALEVARGLGAVRDALRLSAHGAQVGLVTGLTPRPQGLPPVPASLAGDLLLPPEPHEAEAERDWHWLTHADHLRAQAELLEAEREAVEGRARLVARQARQLELALAALSHGTEAEARLAAEVLAVEQDLARVEAQAHGEALARAEVQARLEAQALAEAQAEVQAAQLQRAARHQALEAEARHPSTGWVGRVALALATGLLGVALGVYLAG